MIEISVHGARSAQPRAHAGVCAKHRSVQHRAANVGRRLGPIHNNRVGFWDDSWTPSPVYCIVADYAIKFTNFTSVPPVLNNLHRTRGGNCSLRHFLYKSRCWPLHMHCPSMEKLLQSNRNDETLRYSQVNAVYPWF